MNKKKGKAQAPTEQPLNPQQANQSASKHGPQPPDQTGLHMKTAH